ncbi:MAG TPA: hypothetical protein VFZ40_02945 [Pyrinomonadaceae bacterium]
MKRKITLSVALVLSVILLSLMNSDSSVSAQQPPQRFRFDTGLIIPGPHILRITVAAGSGNDKVTLVRFGRMEYTQGTCDSGVCKHAASSQTLTDRIMLAPGEGATFDLTDGTSNTIMGVRGVVESNRPNVTVALQIISLTGEVTSHIIVANASPWGDN